MRKLVLVGLILFIVVAIIGCVYYLTENKVDPKAAYGSMHYIKQNMEITSYAEQGRFITTAHIYISNKSNKNIKLKAKCGWYKADVLIGDRETQIIAIPPHSTRRISKTALKQNITLECKYFDMVLIEKIQKQTRE